MEGITRTDFKDLEKNLVHSTSASARIISESLDELNKTIQESSKSTEKLGNRTWWLNVVIAVSALIGAIKVFFDIFVCFSTKQ